jgi:hypothetical protein
MHCGHDNAVSNLDSADCAFTKEEIHGWFFPLKTKCVHGVNSLILSFAAEEFQRPYLKRVTTKLKIKELTPRVHRNSVTPSHTRRSR